MFKFKLDNMTKSGCMFINGSNMLDDMLGNMKDVGFEYSSINKTKIKIPSKKFVRPKKKTEFLMVDHIFQQLARHVYHQQRGHKNSSWKCHHYGRYGHIMP